MSDTRTPPRPEDGPCDLPAGPSATAAGGTGGTGSTGAALADEVEGALAARDRVVIGVLLVASFVVILNETVMSVALLELQTDLGVSSIVGQWLTTAFLLTMGVVIPLTGFLIQRFGVRTLFGAAMGLFSLGTLVAMLAPGFAVLLGARVVQASGTAIMLPLLMTTVMTLVPPARRGAMMGNISIVIAVAPALGPTLSGVVLDHLGWRWIFGLVLPVAVVALVAGLRILTDVTPTSAGRVDLLSVPLAVLGFGGLVYGLVQVGHAAGHGGSVASVGLPLGVGLLALVAFLGRQLVLARSDRALLDLRVFVSSQFRVCMAAMVVAMGAMLGTLILLPIYAQGVIGLSVTQTGLLSLPGGIAMAVSGPVVGRIFDARGPRVLLVPGTLLIASALWMLTTIGPGTSPWFLMAANLVLFLGLSATFTPLMTSGLAAVPPALYAHGSAVLGTFQQVAGAAGTALFVTVLTVVSTSSGEAGASFAAAQTDGVRAAFLVGACLSLVLVVVGLLVRRPATSAHGTVPAAH